MTITPLTRIAGVPDALIVAVNARLRQIGSGAASNTGTVTDSGGAPVSTAPVTPVAGTPAGDVAGLTVSGVMDPVMGIITLDVSVVPPADPLFEGCHLYAEIPDQSGGAANTVGVATVGGSTAVGGAWAPIDLGVQPYSAGTQPWVLTLPVPPGVDPTLAVISRLCASSVSASVDNPLVRANTPGATPSEQFTIYPLAPGSPSAATNVTALCGPISPLVLPNDNSTGKLQTPVLITVSSSPTNIAGWSCQLVLVWAGNDPTVAANQQVVGIVFTTAGPVYGSPDKIPIPHSFAVLTPTSVTNATIYAQSGLMNASGAYQWNNIVPGVTPSCVISVGVTTGTTDAASVMASTIAASMAVVSGLFGVAAAGITNPLLGPLAVATINVQALAVTNPLLASLCVQAAQLAMGSVTATAIAALAVGTAAIQNAAITNALIANLAVSGAQIQNATILGANIAFGTIADANIGSCSVSKLTAATATFTGTVTLQMSGSGPSVGLASTGVTLAAGSNLFTVTSTLLSMQSGTNVLEASASGVTLSSGSNSVALTSTTVTVTGPGSSLTMTSTLVTLLAATGSQITLSSAGVATFTASSTSTTITGNTVATGGLVAVFVTSAGYALNSLAVSSTATAGSDTLPSNPEGFFEITINGTIQKVPYYGV